ncbi:MAG: transposase [Ktedonobacterales bacterium]
MATHDPQQVVFVDESGTHTSLTRLYGWAPHDQRATGTVPRNHGKNTTLVAALTPEGLQEPWLLVERAMTTETFAWYIREQVVPRLRPGQIVVLDTLSAHKAASIREALVARGCDLLFLPPYSPDFTPSSRRSPSLRPSCAVWAPGRRKRCTRRCGWRSRPLPLQMRRRGSPMRDTPYLLNQSESCSNTR